MLERQILWYKKSEAVPESHIWNFLIVNRPREIEGIKQKIYEELKSVIEEKTIDEGLILDSEGLHYKIFSLTTTNPNINFNNVYLGKVRKDRRLQSRVNYDGWIDFIEKIHLGQI